MAGSKETDPINELEENLQCTVCLETLKDPRTLPCWHSFCQACLEDVVKTYRDTAPRGREFPCPNCRALFILEPDKHVADMPRNYFICNIVKVAAVLGRGIGVPCSHNCSQSYSVARCVTCEKFLCRECLTAHNNFRGHDDHSVLTMEELSKPENRMKINDKLYCKEHSGMILKVYCETCDELICRDCMDFKHAKDGHSCFLVKDVAGKYKDLLASNKKEMEGALSEGNVLLQDLTLATGRLKHESEKIKSQILDNKEIVLKRVAEMLERKTEILLNKVDQICKTEQAKLDKQIEGTKLYVENVKTSVQLSKKLVGDGTDEEIISSQKMMLDNAHSLLSQSKDHLNVRIPPTNFIYTADVCSKPIKEEILKELENSLGDVNGFVNYDSGANTGGVKNKKSNLNPKASAFSVRRSVSYPDVGRSDEKLKGQTSTMNAKTSAVDDNKCPICLSDFSDKKTLSKCGHSFCTGCIDEAFKHQQKCPVCYTVYNPLTGNQPEGHMFTSYQSTSLPGFNSCGTIVISYAIPSGVQGSDHPNPGKPFVGTRRDAYLPNNEEGMKVLNLLKKAFEQKLIFTIGRSAATGRDDCVIWNGISHKISISGGPILYGYPDSDYLKRVQEQLAARGITEKRSERSRSWHSNENECVTFPY